MSNLRDKYFHTTQKGEKILLKDMDIHHLINTIRHIEKRAESGVYVCFGGFDGDEPWFDGETLYGKDALARLNYNVYVEELKLRTEINN